MALQGTTSPEAKLTKTRTAAGLKLAPTYEPSGVLSAGHDITAPCFALGTWVNVLCGGVVGWMTGCVPGCMPGGVEGPGAPLGDKVAATHIPKSTSRTTSQSPPKVQHHH